eukprot:415771_1
MNAMHISDSVSSSIFLSSSLHRTPPQQRNQLFFDNAIRSKGMDLARVHASTVNQLFAKIADDPNVQWMSRYGALKQSQQYVRRKMAIKYLQILSGGDHLQLINDLLTPMDVAQHIEPCNNVCIIYSFVVIFIYYFVTFIQIIRDLITATNTWTDTKCKSHYLQFISPYYSLNELKSLECTCGWRSHHTSKQWRLLHRTITPFDPKFGRKPFGSDVEQNIFEFLESNSRIAANNISAKHNTSKRHRGETMFARLVCT